MSLNDVLPAVRSLSPEEKAELLRIVGEELAVQTVPAPSLGGAFRDCPEAAEILYQDWLQRRGKK